MYRVHIVDSNIRRRAEIARMVFASSLHAEIYDSYQEVISFHPVRGVLVIANPAGAGGLARILAAGIFLPTIGYGVRPLTREIVETMNLGAINYLDWPFTGRTLVPALEDARTAGKKKALETREFSIAHKRVERLITREHQVLHCLVDGQRTKDIAQTLQISPRTVEIHRGNLMRKLEVETVAEAIKIALRAGLDDEAREPDGSHELIAKTGMQAERTRIKHVRMDGGRTDQGRDCDSDERSSAQLGILWVERCLHLPGSFTQVMPKSSRKGSATGRLSFGVGWECF